MNYHYQPLLIDSEVKLAKGKNLEALQYSRMRRDRILRRFRGELPMSIMSAKIQQRKHDPVTGSYRKSSNVNPDQEFATVFDVSGQSVRAGALSMFPQNIGRAMVMLYSAKGETVLDPFAGHNSRMELVIKANRNYVGYDVCESFMEFNEERADDLRINFPDAKIDLHLCDSRRLAFTGDNSSQFTLTSPPYWDLEYYGPEPEQIGTGRTYLEFLGALKEIARENYRCLTIGGFCVWFVNDFRKGGRFYAYHMDVWNLLIDVGFKPWDLLIVDLGYPIRAAFATQIVDQQILPKRHEYGLIVRK